MNSGPTKAVLVFAAGALLLIGAFSGVARAEDRAQIDQLFKQATEAWKEGKYKEADTALKQLLAQDPSQETAYELLRKVENSMLLDMLTRGGDLEKAARTLLDLAQQVRVERSKDAAAIKPLVDKAVHGENSAVRTMAVNELVAKHGEYAVPYLYPYLGSNDTNERVYAVLALSQLSTDAVLPLVQVLHSDNKLIQRNAALVLERIGDIRAVGGLADLSAHAQDPEVKKAAAAAAAKVADGEVKDLTPVNAYLWLARKYYAKDSEVIRNYLSGFTLWSFKDGKLTSRDVPRYLYHLELAEDAAYDALTASPQSQEARNYVTAILYAEWGTLESLGSEEQKSAPVKKLVAHYWNVIPIARSQGMMTQLGVLALGLTWGDPWVCRQAISALPAICHGPGHAIPAGCPLVKALDAPDKTVRLAAAIAALEIGPEKAFPGSDKVAPLAAQAVATGSMRQVLLIEPDSVTRAKDLKALDDAHLFAVAEPTGLAGYMRAKEVGTFDVIVMRYKLKDELAVKLVNELRRDFRTKDTPILITGDEAELAEAKSLFGTNVQGYLSPDPLDVKKVHSVASQSLNDDQMRALAVSRAACEALAGLDKAHTAFKNYSVTEAALDGVLSSDKPDDIRLAALSALGNLGSAKSVMALVETFDKTANATTIRVGAANALGRILKGQAAPAKVYAALFGGLGDGAKAIRAACGDALGSMKLMPAQENQILTKYRVE